MKFHGLVKPGLHGVFFARENMPRVKRMWPCALCGLSYARNGAGLAARPRAIPKQRVFAGKQYPVRARLRESGRNRKCENETMREQCSVLLDRGAVVKAVSGVFVFVVRFILSPRT